MAVASVLVLFGAVGAFALTAADERQPSRASSAGAAEEGGRDESKTTTSTRPEEGPLTDSELVRRYGDAVWRVEVDGCGLTGSGTAFAIEPNLLVTNHHVVAIDPTPTLRARDGRTLAGEVIGMSASPDVALIRVGDALDPTLEWADPTSLSEGDHLLGLGYPVPAMDFSATPGSIVSFQVNGGVREAVRTDGALDRGNSGGPALNDHGQVIGIVTEMASSDGFQYVPLVFTHDAVEPMLSGWDPAGGVVTPDCGVSEPPPIPDWYFDEGYVPDIELPPVEVPEYELPTTTTVPCPTGQPSVAVTEFDAVEQDPTYMSGWYDVTVRGTITNNTSADISTYIVEVDVGASYPAMGYPDSMTLRPGESTSWEGTAFDQFPGPPSPGNVTFDWDWASYEHYGCGSG